LNAACKEDPAHLGIKYNAINLDITDHCYFSNTDLKTLRNYVQGDVLNLRATFEEKHFPTIVLGEFLEHCVPAAAKQALISVREVLTDDGVLVVTYPLDDRPKEVQHALHMLVSTVEGDTGHDITTYHQTVWDAESLDALLKETGWVIEQKQPLHYGFLPGKNPGGYGMMLKKG
jgi:SAM-dependent methyltransferase